MDSSRTIPSMAEFWGFSKPMSNEEIEHHKDVARQMGQEKRSLAEIKAYLDVAGVPEKKKVDYATGTEAHLGGLLMSALHGATFGWDDEGVGSLYGLITGASAQAGRDVYRAHLQAFHDAHPIQDLGAQMLGGVATGGALAGVTRKAIGMAAPKALQWMSELGVVNKVLASSAAGGAAYAAGDAQGSAMERLAAMPKGAAVGAAFGGGLMGVGAVGSVLAKPLLRNIPLLKKVFKSPGEQAEMQHLADFENDKVKISDALLKAHAMHLQGLTPTIADLGGENTLGRMQAVQAVSGEGMQAIKQGFMERQQGSGDRIMDWFQGKVKLSLQNLEQVRQGWWGARRLDGDMLYKDALYYTDANGAVQQTMVPMTPTLEKLFRNKHFKDAWNQARLVLREQPDGVDIGSISSFLPEHGAGPQYGPQTRLLPTGGDAGARGQSQFGGALSAAGDVGMRDATGVAREIIPPKQSVPQEVVPHELSLAGLDYTKRYLDNLIREGSKEGADAVKKGIAHGVAQNLETALKEIDLSAPKYGKARGTYHSDSKVIDAMEEGSNFLKTSADKITVAMQSHSSKAETEAYKLGVVEDIRDAIYNRRGKVPDVASMLYTKEMRRRLQAVFGQDAESLLDRIKNEVRFGESWGKTQGSRTAPLLGAMANNEAAAAGVAANVLGGRGVSALVLAARYGGFKMKLTHGEEVANAMAENFTAGLNDPQELISVLMNLARRKPRPSTAPRYGAVLGAQANAQPYRPNR